MPITVFMPQEVELISTTGNSNHLDNIFSYTILDLILGVKIKHKFVSIEEGDQRIAEGLSNSEAALGFMTPFTPKSHLFGREEPHTTLFSQMFSHYGPDLVDRFGMYMLSEDERTECVATIKETLEGLLTNPGLHQYITCRVPRDNTFYTSDDAEKSFRELLIAEIDSLIKTVLSTNVSKYVNLDDSENCNCPSCRSKRRGEEDMPGDPMGMLRSLMRSGQ